MRKLTNRDKQTIRFLEWIKKYPGWWHLICTPNDKHMNISIMYTLIKYLAKEQLYEIIFVLLMVHRKEKYMENISEFMLLEMVTENWGGRRKDKEQIIKSILQYFE